MKVLIKTLKSPNFYLMLSLEIIVTSLMIAVILKADYNVFGNLCLFGLWLFGSTLNYMAFHDFAEEGTD